MAMKKQYVSVGGQVIYEAAGEKVLTYGRDALGSVVAGYDHKGNAWFTARYKPFGEFVSTTGSVAGQRFLWGGTWGYRFTSGVPVSHYVRARHLSMRMGMWTSVDPLWPMERAYGYVENRTLTLTDSSGLCINWMSKGVATCRFVNSSNGKTFWKKFVWCSGAEPCRLCKCPTLDCAFDLEAKGSIKGYDENLVFKGTIPAISSSACTGLTGLNKWVSDLIDRFFIGDIWTFLSNSHVGGGKSGYYTDCAFEYHYYYASFDHEGCKIGPPGSPCAKGVPGSGGPFPGRIGTGRGGGGSW